MKICPLEDNGKSVACKVLSEEWYGGDFFDQDFLMTQSYTEEARRFTEGMGWNLRKGKIRKKRAGFHKISNGLKNGLRQRIQ